MITRMGTWLVICAAGMALLAGCGDEGTDAAPADDSTEVSTSSLSKGQFVREVNEICERSAEGRAGELAELRKETPRETELGDRLLRSLEEVLAPSWISLSEDIRAVGAPAGNEAQVERFVAALRRLGEMAGSAAQGEYLNSEVTNAFNRATAAARANGIDCPIR